MLYIVTGLPYAGKTTLAERLRGPLGAAVASVDEVLTERGYEITAMTQADWDEAYGEAFARLEQHLRTGRPVIFDGGSLKRSERDALRATAERLGARHVLIYVAATPEQIRQRWRENEQTRTRGQLAESSLAAAFAMFEEPAADERPIVYTPNTRVEDLLLAISRDEA